MIIDNKDFELRHGFRYSVVTKKDFVFTFYKNVPLKRARTGAWGHTDEFIPLLDLDKHP